MSVIDEIAAAIRKREIAQNGVNRWQKKLQDAEAKIQALMNGTATSASDEGTEDEDTEEEDDTDDELAPANLWRSDAASEGQPWRSADDESEEAKLDSVLAKLHDSGFDALSMEDRQLLERASRRYRNRLQRGTAEDA